MDKKTKEEILYPKVRSKSGVRDALFNSDGVMINHDILEAMDEYATQQTADLKAELEECNKDRLGLINGNHSLTKELARVGNLYHNIHAENKALKAKVNELESLYKTGW